ncbi:unnamed protein product [Arctogadus glacialis]
MAAVEYGDCPSIHTSRLARFEYGIRVLEVYLFSPDLNWNVLRTQNLSTQYVPIQIRTVRVLEHGTAPCGPVDPSPHPR